MLTMLRTAAIAGLIGATGLASAPVRADGIHVDLQHDHIRYGIFDRDRDRFHTPYGYEDGYVRIRHCTPERALYKAYAMGVHHARIDYVSERKIGVVGRSQGDRVYLTFARAPSCPFLG
jgi:hypothetical protein